MTYHEPVLKEEVIAYSQIREGKKYIDCTLGDGGHTIEFLKRGALVLGLDINTESLDRATKRVKKEGLSSNFTPILGNFKKIEQLATHCEFSQVDGILYDLGYSSYQMDESELGLSFQKDKPLDMRLDDTLGVTAADLVNALPEKQLAELIFKYSQENLARKFAKAIVNARNLKKIETTKQLADLIASQSFLGYEKGRIHPATRTFQALRIVVNDELENLAQSLPQAPRLLLPGGFLIVISFHSMEDKLVKQFSQSAGPKMKAVNKKPIVPSREEVAKNIRSRSAKMRVLEKL